MDMGWIISFKVLLVVSSALTGMGLVCLGVYMWLRHNGYSLSGFELIPLISFAVVLFAQSCGVVPLPFVVISEILPREVQLFPLSHKSDN